MIPIVAGGLVSLALKFITDKALAYIAMRALIITLVTVTLPIILKNVITWMFQTLISTTLANLPDGSGLQSFVLQFHGVGGFFATHLRICEAVSFIITALTIRLTLNLIPMVR
ncbi:hypothetical protein ACUUL3_04770 [Thiovibrio sp. JS02]